jgi:FkbM family methyltransferase
MRLSDTIAVMRNMSALEVFRVLRSRFMCRELRAHHIRYVLATLESGEQLRIRTNDRMGQRLLVEKYFEPALRKTLRQHVREGMTVLDIGANIGYFTVQLSTLVGPHGRVIAFEPQPFLLGELRANLTLNRCENVVIMPCALSNAAGRTTFFVPTEGYEGYGSLRSNGRFQVASRVEVETATLDHVPTDLRIGSVDVIKMDTEGAELPILQGARGLLASDKPPTIVFEGYQPNCTAFGYKVGDLLQFLRGHGYRLEKLDAECWIAVCFRAGCTRYEGIGHHAVVQPSSIC